MTRLCAECAPQWLAWLDYRTRPRFQIHQVCDTAREANDKRKGRHEDWRRTISNQQALIVDTCRRQHRVGQLSLFEDAA